jgi:hypothetical protein
MTDLRGLQHRFQAYLTDSSEAIETDIVSSSNALASHRLGVYFNAYRIRLIDCLAIEYPGLKKHIGDQAFENIALDYLGRFPSSHPSVRWFGKNLTRYLRDSECDNREFVSELANFEWSKGLVFDENDTAGVFSMAKMTEVPPSSWPSVQVKFIPAMRWLDMHWNACPYWVALDKNEPLPEIQRQDYPLRWIIWRKDRDPFWRSLDVHEAWALEVAANGATFAELCEGLCEWISEDQVALVAAGFLKQWISDDLIAHIKYQ